MAPASAMLFVALVAFPTVLSLSKAPPRLLARSDSDDPNSRNAINDLIAEIRRIIREGSDTLPVLDPFQLESISGSFSEEGAYEVTGGLHNVVSTGLGDFDITMSSRFAGVLQVEVATELTVPILHASGGYFFDALLGEVVHLYGDGNMKLDITEFKVKIVAVIRLGTTSSTLVSVAAIIDVRDFEFTLDGLLERGPIDGIYSLVVNELTKVIYQGQKANVEKYLAQILEEPISEAIKDIGMSELPCLIGLCRSGGGDGDGDGDGDISPVLVRWMASDSEHDDYSSAVQSQRVHTLETKQAGVIFHHNS